MRTEPRLDRAHVVESTSRADERSTRSTWDAVGVGIATALAAWTWVASTVEGGDPVPKILLLAGCAVVYALARLVSPFARFIAPAAVVAMAAIVVIASPDEVFGRSPFVIPFGYAHFTWAFFVQASVAALMMAAVPGPLMIRVLAGIAALALATIPFGTVVAGPAVVVAILAVALVLGRPPWARLAVIACGVVAAVGLTGTALLGARYTGLERHGTLEALLHATSNACNGRECSPAGVESVERLVYRAVAERRVALWHDAVVLIQEQPLFGVGPGRFSSASPIASTDRDEPWAHQEFLQQGAETGWPGLVLLVLLFAWGFARLAAVGHPDPVTVLGAVSLALLALHASADFVLHHPAAPLAATALLGTAASEARTNWGHT
jgi:O-antigen ligase